MTRPCCSVCCVNSLGSLINAYFGNGSRDFEKRFFNSELDAANDGWQEIAYDRPLDVAGNGFHLSPLTVD